MSKPILAASDQLDLFERDQIARASRTRAQRLPARERASLGLQPGVGYGDQDLERARYYRALEAEIERQVRQAGSTLKPLTRLGLEGRSLAITPHPDAYTAEPGRATAIEGVSIDQLTVQRNVMSSPLDFLFFQAKSRLEVWEWLCGKRFEYDWHVAHRQGPMTASLDALMMVKIDRERRKPGEPIRPITFRRPGPKRTPGKAPTYADSRLDAISRLGRLAGEISNIGFKLLQRVVGEERWIKDVAGELGASPEYIAQRFREALWEATRHYQMLPGMRREKPAAPGCPEHAGGTYVIDGAEQIAAAERRAKVKR